MTKQKTARKTAGPLPNKPVVHEAASLPLGFESWAGVGAFGLFAFLLLIAPYLFSGFWPATYEYWQNSLFLGLAACVSVLLALEPTTQFLPPRSRLALVLLLFFAWCVISVGGTVYLHDSVLELARVGGVVACFFFARTLLHSPSHAATRLTWLLLAAIIGGALICLPAIQGFITTRNPRQFSAFYNPNLFANYSAMLLPLAAGALLLLRRQSKAAVIGGAIVLFILFLGLFVTSSKGGLLAALCGGLVLVIAVVRAKGERVGVILRNRIPVVAAIVLLVILVGGVLFSQTILPRLSSSLENDHSTMFRLYIWDATLEMALARPLSGWGIGSFPSVFTQFAEIGYTRSAHQSWLQIAAESGFPAMLLLLAACGLAFVNGWQALRTSHWPIAAGALGAVTAFAVHGLTDSGWGIVSISVLLMVVLAVLEAGGWRLEASAREARSAIHWPLLLIALPLAFGSWIYQNAQAGEDLRTESRELMSRGMASTALERAREATKADALSARLQTNLAVIQESLGENAHDAYKKAADLQSTRALNWYDVAFLKGHDDEDLRVEQTLARAIELDPNDTTIRLARGDWLLEKGDARGWEDYEYVAALADKPYGKYRAVEEIVDLNFMRAYAKLAERDVSRKQFARAQKFIEQGLAQIELARAHEPRRSEIETGNPGSVNEQRVQEFDQLEAQFKNLQAKIPAMIKDGS